MGSRTRFFGTVLAMLALNTFYFRPTEPSEPVETEQEEQIDSPPDSQSHLPGLHHVVHHWSRFSRDLTSFWRPTSTDRHP